MADIVVLGTTGRLHRPCGFGSRPHYHFSRETLPHGSKFTILFGPCTTQGRSISLQSVRPAVGDQNRLVEFSLLTLDICVQHELDTLHVGGQQVLGLLGRDVSREDLAKTNMATGGQLEQALADPGGGFHFSTSGRHLYQIATIPSLAGSTGATRIRQNCATGCTGAQAATATASRIMEAFTAAC